MTNHPNRAARRVLRAMAPETRALMDDYVSWVLDECMGADETWPLGDAYRAADLPTERSHIAAAIVYSTDALSDGPWRILETRGRYADPRLCAVADELRLA